jgi:hypothetical protein
MDSTAQQSSVSARKQSDEIRSLSDEELELASGGRSAFMDGVIRTVWNWAILEAYGCGNGC